MQSPSQASRPSEAFGGLRSIHSVDNNVYVPLQACTRSMDTMMSLSLGISITAIHFNASDRRMPENLFSHVLHVDADTVPANEQV